MEMSGYPINEASYGHFDNETGSCILSEYVVSGVRIGQPLFGLLLQVLLAEMPKELLEVVLEVVLV